MHEFDVLVIGTGVVESAFASFCATKKKKVLHIDKNSYYGDWGASLNVKQILEYDEKVNKKEENNVEYSEITILKAEILENHRYREYSIDLNPKIILCRSKIVNMILDCKLQNYIEFQGMSKFHMFKNNEIKNKNFDKSVKEEIFTNKTLSLLQKRNLMKFFNFVIKEDSEKSKIIKQYENRTIVDLLTEHFKIDVNQFDTINYIIGIFEEEYFKSMDFINSTKLFLSSIDVYGKFPALVSRYGGIFEIALGFCRSAAIQSAVYKLKTCLLNYDSDLKIATFNDNWEVKINEKIVFSTNQCPKFLTNLINKITANFTFSYTSKIIVILKNNCDELIPQNESTTFITFPPKSLPSKNSSSVQMLIQNERGNFCPKNQSIIYAHSNEQDLRLAKLDLNFAIKRILDFLEKQNTIMLLENDQNYAKISIENIGSFFNFTEHSSILFKYYFVQKSFPDTNIDLNKSFTTNDSKYQNNVIFSKVSVPSITYKSILSDYEALCNVYSESQ